MEVWDSFEDAIYFQGMEHVDKEISVAVQVELAVFLEERRLLPVLGEKVGNMVLL